MSGATVVWWGTWLSLGLFILAQLVFGARLTMQSRRGECVEVGRIGMALYGVMAISGAGAVVGFLAIVVSALT